jgi:hypothetical protein
VIAQALCIDPQIGNYMWRHARTVMAKEVGRPMVSRLARSQGLLRRFMQAAEVS